MSRSNTPSTRSFTRLRGEVGHRRQTSKQPPQELGLAQDHLRGLAGRQCTCESRALSALVDRRGTGEPRGNITGVTEDGINEIAYRTGPPELEHPWPQ